MTLRSLVLAWSLVGCSSSTATPDARPDSGPAVAGDADSFHKQFCETFVGCCAATMSIDGCVAFMRGSQRGTYDPTRGAKCLDDLRALGPSVCADDLELPASCASAFGSGGSRKLGESCSRSDECATSSDGSVACVDGECRLRALAAIGASPCVDTFTGAYYEARSTTAATAIVCDGTNGAFCEPVKSTCTARGAVGAPCTGAVAYECVDDALCDSSRKCAALKAVGETCAHDGECARGSYCDTTCRAQSAAGAACTKNTECLSLECSFSDKTCSRSLFVEFVCGR